MKVQRSSLTTFTSTPLYNVNLKKDRSNGDCDYINAKFSKLDPDDTEDQTMMGDACVDWAANTEFGIDICSDFLFDEKLKRDNDFYVIEGVDDKGKKKIYSMAEFNPMLKLLSFMQANPNNNNDNIKGSGELMVWGIGKESAKVNPYHYISIIKTPESKGFYEHVGLRWNGAIFTLTSDEAGEFFKKVEERYKLDVEA